MSLLSNIPQGLLAFLGIKNGGQYPQQLLTNLAPVLDLYQHYQYVNSEAYQWNTNLGTQSGYLQIPGPWVPRDISNGVGTFVPNNEWWLMLESSVMWGLDAADPTERMDGGMAYSHTPGGANAVSLILPQSDLIGYNVTNAGVVTQRGGRTQQRPVWLPPGAQLFLFLAAIQSATTVAIQVSVRFTRFVI